MNTPIRTVEGTTTPDDTDIAYMEHLDTLAPDLPCGGDSFGLLLYKGDPPCFRTGKAEWLASQDTEPTPLA